MINSDKYDNIASLLAHLSDAFHDLANEMRVVDNKICLMSERLDTTTFETLETKKCLKDIGHIISKLD